MNEMIKNLADEISWSREIMDVDYNARSSVSPEVFDREIANYRIFSQQAFEKVGCYKNIIYDEVSQQKIDILGVKSRELRPVFFFIHGGYWRMLSKEDSAFMAPNLANFGIATVALDYQLVPEVDLTEIVRQTRAAIAFIHHEGHRYGLDKNQIFVSGSSAGGHLTGAAIAGGWHQSMAVPENIIKGAIPISGIFHLAAMINCFVQDWLALKEEAIAPLSPILNLPRQGCPIVVSYGEKEHDGFLRQSKAFHKVWLKSGFSSEILPMKDCNHFDIVFEFMKPDSQLTYALLSMIGKT